MTHSRLPTFFGYGSLVNRATHDYAPATPARLSGWRRIWCATTTRDHAYLSVERAKVEIEGLLVAVPGNDWADLDRREAAYDRQAITETTLSHSASWIQSPQIYAFRNAVSVGAAPILLSYLDVVLQGFLREFGETGVRRFITSTVGWQAGLQDDRAAPLYPRHQSLTLDERGLIDALILEYGIPRQPA